MSLRIGRFVIVAVLLGATAWIGWAVQERLTRAEAPGRRASSRSAAPVEAERVVRGPIELRRTFSGTLEAPARFVVAPKVAARIQRVEVDLADTVKRGALVVLLEDEEFRHAVTQVEADIAVAKANHAQAESALDTAVRALERTKTLSGRGVASDVQLDAAQADETARRAQVEVAAAHVARAESALQAARMRLGYTRIHAEWTGGSDERVVSERHVDPGDTVSPGAPLLDVVELDDVTAVIHVAERDYARLSTGQDVALTTDAFPGETFHGRIARVAPVFRQSTRQARVEVSIPNPGRRLKPGMFVRATVVLTHIDDAVVVPESALTSRDDRPGVFVIDERSMTAVWHEIRPGIRDEGRVQLLDSDVSGLVVTLGQQLLEDGSEVVLPAADGAGGDDRGEGSDPE